MRSPVEVKHVIFDFTEVVPKERDSSAVRLFIGGLLCLCLLGEIAIAFQCILILWR